MAARSDADRTEAIRRRVQREYVVLTAPPVLDADATLFLVETLVREGQDCDVVIDLRDVVTCDARVVDELQRASEDLGRLGAKVTLSHPSSSFDAVLGGRSAVAFDVRRPRVHRPIRHSARGQT